jgi:predicted thioredoxin/glutaredoxin
MPIPDRTIGSIKIPLLLVGALGKLVTEKPVDFVDFDSVVKFNKNRQNDDNVVKAYKS